MRTRMREGSFWSQRWQSLEQFTAGDRSLQGLGVAT